MIVPAPIVLPSASPSPAPVVLYIFQPPADWQQSPVPADLTAYNVVALYFAPDAGSFRSNVNVVRDVLQDPNETLAQVVAQGRKFFEDHSNTLGASHAEKLCNGAIDGWYLESAGTLGLQATSRVQTVLVDRGTEYIATYSRGVGSDPDPAAVKALDTLCPQPQ